MSVDLSQPFAIRFIDETRWTYSPPGLGRPVGIYDWYLGYRVRRHEGEPPEHVALVITERDLLEPGAYETLENVLAWAFEYGALRVTVYVSVLDEGAIPTLRRSINQMQTPREMSVIGPDDTDVEAVPIQIAVGLGGKQELTEAIRSVANQVADGNRNPDSLTEADIEEELVFPAEPDLVIKTGAERLSDFMIWQSVYSELYFTDVNWRDFRKRDFLRAVYSFKDSARRFGE